MNGQRAIPAIGRGDQAKPARLLLLAHGKLLVSRLESLPLRQEPDLVEMDRLLVGGIEFAVPYPRACGHVLHLARAQHGTVAEAVPMFERPFEDVGDDLHVPVAVRPKPLAGLHAVVVDDPQCAEAHMGGVVVIAKGERVEGIEPAVVEVSPFDSLAYANHGLPHSFTCKWLTYQVYGQKKTL